MNFDQAFERLIGHEGGYVNNPSDPGGETKFGVSKRQYPGEDIKNMTLDRAKFIYRRDYWSQSGAELVPDALKFDLFDTAVNSGPKTAIKLLQRALGVVDDGRIGPVTMVAITHADPEGLLARFNGWRLDFLNDNPDLWAKFGRGWAQRIAENLKAA